VNLALFLPKAGNLAGLGSQSTSRSNLGLGTSAIFDVGALANNIVQLDAGAKIPAYDGSQLTNIDTLPVGTLIWSTGTFALPGTIKANGALLSRASFPRLWTFANASGNIISEAIWLATNSGSYSTGDLSTTFRVIDARAEFIRAYDDGRGIDVRNFGQRHVDAFKDHTHASSAVPANIPNVAGASGIVAEAQAASTELVNSPNGGGTETRPRNITFLACIKF